MTRIIVNGVGSSFIAINLPGDVLSFPELAQAHVTLMVNAPRRLRASETIAHKLTTGLDARPAFEATRERRHALGHAVERVRP